MDWLKAPNPTEIAISVVVGTCSYWASPLVSARVPLWTFPFAVGVAVLVWTGLRSLGRRRSATDAREQREEDRHRELMRRLDGLVQGMEPRLGRVGTISPGGRAPRPGAQRSKPNASASPESTDVDAS